MAKRRAVEKYKLTLSMDPVFARRFAAYCAFIGEDMSDVASRAFRKEMAGFTVSRRIDDQADDQPAEPSVRLARGDRATG